MRTISYKQTDERNQGLTIAYTKSGYESNMTSQTNAKIQDKVTRFTAYQPIQVGEFSFTPSEASTYIQNYRFEHGWIPGEVEAQADMPLMQQQLEWLYQSNEDISKETEQLCTQSLPKLHNLINPQAFDELIARQKELLSCNLQKGSELWEQQADLTNTHLDEIINYWKQNIDVYFNKNRWLIDIAESGRRRYGRAKWYVLISEIETANTLALEVMHGLQDTAIVCLPKADVKRDYQIIESLVKGYKSSFISKLKMKFLLRKHHIYKNYKINTQAPKTYKDLINLKKYLEFEVMCKQLYQHWDYCMSHASLSTAYQLQAPIYKTMFNYVPMIKEGLHWFEYQGKAFINNLKSKGFAWDLFIKQFKSQYIEKGLINLLLGEAGEYFFEVMQIRKLRLEQSIIQNKLENLSETCNMNQRADNSLAHQFRLAIQMSNSALYSKLYLKLQEIEDVRPLYLKRLALLNKLAEKAPEWARAISERQGMHGYSMHKRDFSAAWIWSQLSTALKTRDFIDIEVLSQEITQMEQMIVSMQEELAKKRELQVALMQRTDIEQRKLEIADLEEIETNKIEILPHTFEYDWLQHLQMEYKVFDQRPRGGKLWVLHQPGLGAKLRALRRYGVTFCLMSHPLQTDGHPAWYATENNIMKVTH